MYRTSKVGIPPPVFTITPTDVTVECDAVPGAATVTATDDCDVTVTVTHNEVKTPGNCVDSYVSDPHLGRHRQLR
ncbi:MAG: hypothetical protein IPJ06_05350 [Saprospiraceae bacterium]|nr:hypothetical protein [Saprospiraceae bacterium]